VLRSELVVCSTRLASSWLCRTADYGGIAIDDSIATVFFQTTRILGHEVVALCQAVLTAVTSLRSPLTRLQKRQMGTLRVQRASKDLPSTAAMLTVQFQP
jgi:hypothetical protein